MKNIAILGSTGSIGFTTLKIIKENKKDFKIKLLSTNLNAKKLLKQAKQFKVKKVIISNKKINKLWRKKFSNNQIKVYDNFNEFNKIFINKIDYTINAISGLDGLEPTLNIIKYTKKIAIANKESIICGWNLIYKKLKKYRTEFIPVDSEHFSIFKLINNKKIYSIKKVILTASGGPFFKKKNYRKITIKDALNHPNWKMGKKISIDSSTLMNKVFEVIEAKKIFNLDLKKISILINPNSYLHAIVIFNNGTIKMLAHETKMDIPIYNSIYHDDKRNIYNTKELNLDKINTLELSIPSEKKFKSLKTLKLIPNHDSLFETILVSTNDELVKMFLNREIEFIKLTFFLNKIINFKMFKKYCNVKPRSIKQIYNLRNLVRNIVNDYVKNNK